MVQEVALIKNLRDFNATLAQRYVSTAQMMLKKLELEPKIEEISGGGMKIGFRLTAAAPTYVVLSKSICRFGNMKRYKIGRFENPLDLGLIPVYLASYNRMTMLNFWDKKSRMFFDPHNSPFDDDRPVCWQFADSAMPPKMSSMNFLLPYRSPASRAPENISGLMGRYFSKFFWETRNFDISSSTHFFHSNSKITSMINVVKTIFVVKKILGKRKIYILNEPVGCQELLIAGIFKDHDSYHFKDIKVCIEDSTAESFKIHESQQLGFFNGIVTELEQKYDGRYHSLKLFQIIESYSMNYFDLIQNLIGIVCTDRFEKSSSMSKIGGIFEIKKDVEHMMELLGRETRLDMTVGTLENDWFEHPIRQLFPMLVVKDDQVYYAHPLVWSHFEQGTRERFLDENDPVFENILVVLERIRSASKRELRMMDELDSLRRYGMNPEAVKKEICHLYTDISLAKMTNDTSLE